MSSSESRPMDSPRLHASDVQRLAAAHLSSPSRVGHTLLLVASLTMAVAVGSLWATEPALPMRTRIAFALIVLMSLAWAVFATWVLARRHVLLGTERVVAARMGLVFSAVCTLGMLGVGYWGGMGRPAYLGALVESLLCVVAVAFLVSARRRVDALLRRRQELERQLGIGRGSA